ncbi:MAG: hypothetical protein LBS74_11535 [Oscillospiraceae bacterium]|jgi:hypothetical protein|nr:hypothetical protein [Oscillospiraceae bacterium]
MKKNLLIASALAVALLLVLTAVFKNQIIFYFALKQENIGAYEKAVFKECKSDKTGEFSLTLEGVEYSIPLPKGAAEFANADYPSPQGETCMQYLVLGTSFWGGYSDSLQTLPDYNFDQMGSIIILNSKDGKAQINVGVANYGRKYERLEIRGFSTSSVN